MEDYTKDDVVQALLKIPNDSRKRVLVDQRSYLVGLLAFRFMLSEHTIAKLVGFKRDKINHNKRLVLQFRKDKSYQENVYVYAQMFPFDFNSVNTNELIIHRSNRVELDLDRKVYRKLKAIGAIMNHKDVRTTIKLFIDKGLKLWEE